ncbi:MAG TPA: hypothetical protein VGI76_10390 [Solirubrobacteraceae bacterium]|jgi:hypothetical protein
MAFIVARQPGTWEIRESRATSAGPRSYTLASFHVLTAEVIRKAQTRSSKPLDHARLRLAAARAGAPIDSEPGDHAAGELLAELAMGRRPRALLRRLLLDALEDEHEHKRSSDSARAAAIWISATPQQRGVALRDLLLLADRIPRRRRPPTLSFPPIHSTAAP